MIEIAYAAILLIPLFVVIALARYPLPLAVSLVMCCSIMFLPEKPVFDLPLLPPLGRESIALMVVAVLAWFVERQRSLRSDQEVLGTRRWLPKVTLPLLLLIILLVQPAGTWLTNRDALPAPHLDSGLTFIDYGRMTYGAGFIALAVMLGRRFLSTPDATRALLVALAATGVVYAGLTAFEWRMSPMLSETIYGQSRIRWYGIQRWGAFRPQLFQSIGLLSASLMTTSMIASLALARWSGAKRAQFWQIVAFSCVAGWIFAWSLGSWAIGLIIGAVIVFARPRIQSNFLGFLAVCLLLYPFSRVIELFPTDLLFSIASVFDIDRALSMQFRFDAEDGLIGRTADRPWFGWGHGNRGLVLDTRGLNTTITDSYFIIAYSQNGFVGLLARYGLLVSPLLLMMLNRRRLPRDPIMIGLAFVLVASIVDSFLNDTLVMVRWMVVGALLGRIEYELAVARQQPREETTEPALPASPAPAMGGASGGRRGTPAMAQPPVQRSSGLLNRY
ncbi:MAG: hypothetical protein AAF577_09625 [Pseudomonadota bacterium]